MEGCWRVHFRLPIINIDPPQSSASQPVSEPTNSSIRPGRTTTKNKARWGYSNDSCTAKSRMHANAKSDSLLRVELGVKERRVWPL